MKVAMMMRDAAYRDAIIDKLSGYDKEIFIEIAGSGGAQRDSVILTDIMPSEIEENSLSAICKRTLFLSSVPVSKNLQEDRCRVVFKYSSVQIIISELTLLYSQWTGNSGSIAGAARIIASAGENDYFHGPVCRSLAGQIAYRRGGRIIIIPLSYINDYRSGTDTEDGSWFRRLMYLIDEGRDYPAAGFTFTDSYGVSFLRLPDGINPVSSLDEKYLIRLINSLAGQFDTVILDIGSCFSEANLEMIRRADSVLFFGSSKRITDPGLFLGDGVTYSFINTSVNDPGAMARDIDDFVNDVYGRTDQKTNDSQIQNRNR